jgi:hypothetical protein
VPAAQLTLGECGCGQTVSVLTLQFSEIVDLLSYYDRMRRTARRIANGLETASLQSSVRSGRRPSIESFGSF